MYVLILVLPLAGFFSAGLFGRYIGGKGSVIVTTSLMVATTTLCAHIFYNAGLLGNLYHVSLFTWFNLGAFYNDWALLYDSLTCVMLLVVTIVSSLVHVYSASYMQDDPHLPRFMAYLSLFTFFMLSLVTADNFVQLFFGWEGVGLCSYLLISFWFTRVQANKAAIKAIVVNRVGDLGLILGIGALFLLCRSVEYHSIFAAAPFLSEARIFFAGFYFPALDIITFLLFIGAVGKSAQLGLHTWLPDAMEGPTPVSALIHAATMVTAGVFLLIRCSFLFEYAPTTLLVASLVGALTSFFAATTGLLQNDLKKVIAYSTCSQLGYMVFICGLSNYATGIFHLSNHAFFKALLFLSAGAVIHSVSDEQDMRKMGGLVNLLPFTYTMLLVGSLALMGFPFLSGFYSKDVILEFAFASKSFLGFETSTLFVYWLGLTSAALTAFYSARLLYLTFLGETNLYRPVVNSIHEAPFLLGFPLGVLSAGSIFIGFLTRDMFIGLGTDFFNNSLFVGSHRASEALIEFEFLSSFVKMLPLFFSFGGALLAFYLNHYHSKFFAFFKVCATGNTLYAFFNRKWFFDKIYNAFIVKKAFSFGYKITFRSLDKGVIEFFGPFGVAKVVNLLSRGVSRQQNGLLFTYSCTMFGSLVLLLLCLEIFKIFGILC